MHQQYLFLTIQNVAVPLGLFAMIVLLVWFSHRQKQARARDRAELNKHFLDKFTSGQDLTEFLGKEGGQHFLDEMWAERDTTKERILGTIKGGVVLTTLGVGMLLLTFFWDEDVIVPALLVLSVGVGLLLAAWIAYRFSTAWGISRDDEPATPSQPAA